MRRCSQMRERENPGSASLSKIHPLLSFSVPSCQAPPSMPWYPVPATVSSARVRTLHSCPHPVITPLPLCECQALGQSPGILECWWQNVRTQGIPEQRRQRWLMSPLPCNCPDDWNYLIRSMPVLVLTAGTRLSRGESRMRWCLPQYSPS